MLVGLATLGALGLTWSSNLDKQVDIQPNQGIQRSCKNALLASLLLGTLFGLATGLSFYITRGFDSAWRGGLWYAFLGALGGGLVFGGYTGLQHLVLRLVLYREGVIPRDYVRFLNYATERIFLRRVGAGYVFIHRLLLEHLAKLMLQKLNQIASPSSRQRFAWLMMPAALLIIMVTLFGVALFGVQIRQGQAARQMEAMATAVEPTATALMVDPGLLMQLISEGDLPHKDDDLISLAGTFNYPR